MKVFNVVIILLVVIALTVFFFLYSELSTTEVDSYSDGQAGIGAAILFIYLLWALLANIVLMFTDLVVILIARKWNDRFSKITLIITVLVVLIEFLTLFTLNS